MKDEERQKAEGRRQTAENMSADAAFCFLPPAFFSFIPHPSSLILKLRRALRGEVDARVVALEAWRRSRASVQHRRERGMLEQLAKEPARLRPPFAQMQASQLLEHFRQRTSPSFLPGFNLSALGITASLQRTLFSAATTQLLERATRIANEHCWSLLGYGEKCFGVRIEWQRDPVSGLDWPLDYHGDIQLLRGDGSDARVLWELNRLAHLITLGRAFAVSSDEKYAMEFFAQLESWREQNPVGRGANWACAMEVGLRAMNLLAAFQLFLSSPQLNEETLSSLLAMFDQHGAHIRRNLEFSYIATSNHYLSDVVGLLWIGLMLPELAAAEGWHEFGLHEMLREMDKQVLADGADFESSTGYHRFVLELFLYSFILCRANGIEIESKYWHKLYAMLDYVRAYLRPDQRAPLIGDTDSGQVLPIVPRAGDDHAYVLALGGALFLEPAFKNPSHQMPEELLWILGEKGVCDYESLPETQSSSSVTSQAFADAGTYILREGDSYLLFNASGSGIGGRGSHGHNDALSIEVCACGCAFIVDPGTYVYTSDPRERHYFRSTAYHSTVEVDGVEQNTIDERIPFVIGDEAHPRVLRWYSTAERDIVIAEHDGYKRLAAPITHRRAVEFNKRARFWMIEDALLGEGEHLFRFRFHFAASVETSVRADGNVQACDKIKGARLFISALDLEQRPELESRFTSRDYGAKSASVSVCWTVRASAPLQVRWVILPVCAGEDERARLELIAHLKATHPSSSAGVLV